MAMSHQHMSYQRFYLGRAHFFRRYFIRGATHLVFYSLPEYPQFYSEILNLLGEGGGAAGARDAGAVASSVTLFTRFDKLALERVVGRRRARNMLKSDNSTSIFR